MITWRLHTDDYGLHSFETWWLEDDGKRISPLVPSEAGNVGDETAHYLKGRKIDRVLRSATNHEPNYQLHGRGFDGYAHHVIAIECFCKSHEVVSHEGGN